MRRPGPEADLPPRARYERPAILSREKLEVIAALCVPSPPAKGDPGMCPDGPISS